MQPHIGVNENENELTHVQKGRTYSEYELLAFPDGYDLLASSRRSRYTAQYTVWKLMNLQARIRILGTPWHNPVTEVFVYRGLGGDSISLSNCINVKQVLYQLDELTDWLWGLAVYPKVVDMETKLAVKPEQRFFGGTVCLQILYDIRVSSLGFPCYHCFRFVSWEEFIWFTRYHKFEEQAGP